MPEQTTLTIQGREYSLSKIPDFNDPLVKAEVAKVVGQLSLQDITDNLYMSVELIFVAYNGVAGAKGGTIQAEIAGIQSDLALLCNECVKTMTTFREETGNILVQLVSTYKWLTKGKESLALKKLAHCKESSRAMSESAHQLAEGFKEIQARSTKARSNSIEAEASERDRKLAAEQAEREIREKQVAAKKDKEALVGQIKQMDTLYQDAKSREEDAQDKAMIMGITSAITGAIGAGLGAFAAAQNPIGTALNGMAKSSSGASASSNNAELENARQEQERIRKESTEAQQNLLEAKDAQVAAQSQVDTLNKEIESLNKKISELEVSADSEPATLEDAKKSRDNKQTELARAQTALEEATKKVEPLKKQARDLTAQYAAAGTAFQNIAQSTGQMAQSAMSAEAAIQEEKMKFLNKKLELEEEKRRSLVALAEYAEKVKNLKTVQGQAQVSVNSLHAAVEALGKIIGTLTNASLFWDQMSKYCERMTDQGFQQELADITSEGGLTKEERLEYYYDQDFMSLFLGYTCQWVAINGLSETYLESAQTSQQKAVEYLRTSPTIEQALQQAPELAKNMAKMVSQSLLQSRTESAQLEQQKALLEAKQSVPA